MSQDQAIEAARTRIQRLVEEIALLAKKEMPSEQFFPEFIGRVAKACDARGGAVWLVGQRNAEGNSEFQLAAGIEFESSLFQTDEVQRALLLRAMQECAASRKPIVLAPQHQQPDPNSTQAQLAQLQGTASAPQNKTPYPFLHVALPLKDAVVGVLQLWLQPYVTPQNYAEFAQFLGSLVGYVETHLQSRRLGTLVLETQRLQHLLKFTTDLAGSLEILEVSRLAANYGRDLIGCERCSVLWLDGAKWRVLSISGQEVVEKKSSMVKAMTAFVGAHVRSEAVTLSKKELLARHAGNGDPAAALDLARNGHSDDIDRAYFDVSHVVSAVIAPVLDEQKQLVGAYFAESTNEGFFDAKDAPPHRVTEWLALHTGKSLIAAHDYQTLPFLTVGRRLRATRLALTGPKRQRNFFRLIVFGGLAAAILLLPWMDKIEGDCSLVPEQHAAIVPEVAGRIEKILVREGSKVSRGDPIAQLDKRRIETELERSEAEIRGLHAEAEKARGSVPSDEASAQIADLQALAAEKNAEKLRADLEATTLRSPIDGVVLTKDVEKHGGEALQAGQPFAEVAALDAWDVRIDVPERDIGKIEQRLEKGPIEVGFILYSESAQRLTSTLEHKTQISAAAEPRHEGNVFVITLENVAIPERVQTSMRPGLSGRAKIQLGRKPLIFLWARDLWNWGRMRML